MPKQEQHGDALDAFRFDADSPLTDERRAELAPKLEALISELVKMQELEDAGGEPSTPWPWRDARDF